MEKKEGMVATTETVEKKEKSKTFTRDELNKIVNAEKSKIMERYQTEIGTEKYELKIQTKKISVLLTIDEGRNNREGTECTKERKL